MRSAPARQLWPLCLAMLVGGGAGGVTLACAGGSAATQAPADAARASFSLQALDCSSCGEDAAAALGKVPGVYSAQFDPKSVELRVAYNPQALSEADVLGALRAQGKAEGFGAMLGSGAGAYLPSPEFPSQFDMKQISKHGEYVELLVNMAPGKVTVFDFHARWCGPCREVDAHMHSVLRARSDVALRRLDVVDWESEVAKAYLKRVPALPYIEVWDAYGKRVARISGLDLQKLDAAIDKAANRSK